MQNADLYYALAFGQYPYDNQVNYDLTCLTIQRLIDNKMPEAEIERIIEVASERQLPFLHLGYASTDNRYMGNLIKDDVFYYHPELQMRSPGPKFNPLTGETTKAPFYLEMVMSYSNYDVVNYAINKLKFPMELYDSSRENGAIEYLFKKYSKVEAVETVDFILFLIDEAAADDRTFSSILDITQYEVNALDRVKRATAEAKAKGADRIVWRTIG